MANPKVEWSVQGAYTKDYCPGWKGWKNAKKFWCSLNGKSKISGLRVERTTNKEDAERVKAEISKLYPACTYRLVKRQREATP